MTPSEWSRKPLDWLPPDGRPLPGRWIRVLAAVLGVLAGGVAGASLWAATCLELDCLGWFIGAGIGAVLGAPIGYVITLGIQRWRRHRVRRREQVQ